MATEEVYDPQKHGAVLTAPPPPQAEEAYDEKKHGKLSATRPLEFKDAPTIAALSNAEGAGLKHYDSPMAALRDFPTAIKDLWDKSGRLNAGTFGPLMTDNPRARQEIVAKNYPGAKPVDDKYGNPMIEFQGKRYYTSRPGEIDAMDIARGGLGIAATAPALAAAPASLAGAVALGVGTNVGQSIGEDVLARHAGGTSQDVDLTKAGVAGLLGTLPLVGKGLTMGTGKLYGLLGPSFLDATGNLTAKGASVLKAAGINADILTPAQLKALDVARRENFGSTSALQTQTRKELASEFGTDLTRGQATRDAADVVTEDALRSGGRGADAQKRMVAADVKRQEQLTEAQNVLRTGITGQAPMEASEAGARLSRGYLDADEAARRAVADAYTAASDPAQQAANGIVNKVPITQIADLTNSVRQSLTSGPGSVVMDKNFSSLYPRAAEALDVVKEWAAQAAAPATGGAPKITGLSWDSLDKMRRQLAQYRDAAFVSGNKTDQRAVSRIMTGFDNHFAGQNSLIDAARQAHADRMGTFMAGKNNTAATNRVLKTLGLVDDAGEAVAPGAEVVNKIFSTANRGEAAPVIEHLKGVYAGDPVAMGALKDQALRRIMVDETGNALSPQKATTALNKALEGNGKEAYEALFSKPELDTVRRFLAHNTNLAEALKPGNPSGSGHILSALFRKGAGVTLGGAAGHVVGHAVGGPVGGEIGAVAGGLLGTQADHLLANRAVTRALNPPSSLMPQLNPLNSRLGLVGGLLGREELN